MTEQTPPPAAPFDPTPFDPTPVDAAPYGGAPVDPTPYGGAPVDAVPVDAAPVDPAPYGGAPFAGAPYAPTMPAPMLESEARTWAMLAHIIAAVGALVSAGTIAFLAPLVIWLVYKDRSALVGYHGKQNLNLQITNLVILAGAVVLGVITFGIGFIFTLPLWGLYALYALIISIVAGVKAYNGEYYRIPMSINFIK